MSSKTNLKHIIGDRFMYTASRNLILRIAILLLLMPGIGYGATDNSTVFSKEELQQLVAPIALYPDPLLAQILMASTYPLEVVTAARWMRDNANLKGADLDNAVQQQPWDDSIKSLTRIPTVLAMMDDKLDMTQKLGDAFLAQQNDVLGAVQALRAKARTANNLNSSKEQVVTIEPTATGGTDETNMPNTTIITIEPTDPNVVSIPVYDPSLIYGTWDYPSYPPYFYYPPGYAAGTLLAFTAGAIVGNALWGTCNWHNGNIDINSARFNNFNHRSINNTVWQHNVAHRGNVPYRGMAQQKYGKGELQSNAARATFRGHVEQSPAKALREDVGQRHPNLAQTHPNDHRGGAYQGSNTHLSPQSRPNLYEGLEHGHNVQRFSQRGASSIQSSRLSSHVGGGFNREERAQGSRMGGGGRAGHGGRR